MTGLSKGEIDNRMLTQNVDQKHLFSDLIKLKLIRRVDGIRYEFEITSGGIVIIKKTARSIINMHRRQLAHLSHGELAELTDFSTKPGGRSINK